MALESVHSQAARPNHLVVSLCAAVALAVLGTLNFAMGSDRDASGQGVASETTMGTHLVLTGDAQHRDDNCGHDHNSPKCSPCPTCSGALPVAASGESKIVALARAPAPASYYDDIVPRGVRRPPRLS